MSVVINTLGDKGYVARGISSVPGEWVEIVEDALPEVGDVLTATGPYAACWQPSGNQGSNTASDTVVTETAFGNSSTAGILTTYSRGDHSHGTPTNPVTAHEAASDPHPLYTLSTELVAHEEAADPHPVYALDSDLSSHISASDPHTGYQRESEKGATSGYASLDAGGKVPLAQLDYTGLQPLDSDLTTIAGLTATTNNFIASVGSAWASLTPAQVKTTLAIANTDVSGLGTLSTQSGTFSGTSSGTNTGDQTSIAGIQGTKAQFDTAVTDGNFLYSGDITQYTDELAQDSIGAMVDANWTAVYLSSRLMPPCSTGARRAAELSNTTALG